MFLELPSTINIQERVVTLLTTRRTNKEYSAFILNPGSYGTKHSGIPLISQYKNLIQFLKSVVNTAETSLGESFN